MFSVGGDELEKAPLLGKTIKCAFCGKRHRVESGDRGSKLQFYSCGKTVYLVGVCGKDLRKKAK